WQRGEAGRTWWHSLQHSAWVETSCLARPAAHTSAPLRLSSLRRDLPYGGLEMVRNIKEAPLPLHHDDHDPGLQIVVVKLRLPLARGARLCRFFTEHFLHPRDRL